MTSHPPPSTQWAEQIAPDEQERYAEYAKVFADIQQRRSKRHGPGRALHRKQLCAAQGHLQVLDGVPSFAKHGLFALPREYEVWVRLSNGGMDRASDATPDIRGFSVFSEEAADIARAYRGLARACLEGAVRQEVEEVPLEQAPAAWERVRAGAEGRKLVLMP